MNEKTSEVKTRNKYLQLIKKLKLKVENEVIIDNPLSDKDFLELFYKSINEIEELLVSGKSKDNLAVDHLEYQLYLLKEESELDYPLSFITCLISTSELIKKYYE